LNDARTTTQRATQDPRLQRLQQWLERDLGFEDYAIAPASADASFRRYFRVTRAGHEPRVVMDAPPEKEDVGPYLRVAAMLQSFGVHAPQVLERSERDGFLLLTDLGSTMYLPELAKPGRADPLYADAIGALVRIQARGAEAALQLPPYDERLLRFEMSLFPDWLLQRHLGLELDGREAQVLRDAMDALVASALEQPQGFVHRDYHSRNLMVCPGRNPGILDFQDAVRGALTYDLISLLRDAYVEWPQDRVVGWALQYRREAGATGLDTGRDEAQFLRWFDLIGLQRQLKVAGIFARLWHRDGKPGYLPDIPRTLGYAVGACRRQPDFRELGRLIERRVLPALVAKLGERTG
jgi:aminoglycoside/choline kinase family phosphotransferase